MLADNIDSENTEPLMYRPIKMLGLLHFIYTRTFKAESIIHQWFWAEVRQKMFPDHLQNRLEKP
jgi:hypothetical protein